MLPLLKKPDDPESIIISYLTLRKVIGFFGILLVPVLIIGSWILVCPIVIQVSVSAYYYTCMRNLLEGVICGISLFLLSYHGYKWYDSVTSKITGLFALGIAFFPTSECSDKTDIISKLHNISAGIFFAALAFMSIFLFTKSSGYKTPQKKKRNRIYRVCGIIIIVSVIGIAIDNISAVHERIGFLKPTLIFETLALTAFGFSWLTKGEFLLKDKPVS